MSHNTTQHKASELIIKHLSGVLTTVERVQLEEWINENPKHKKLFEELTEERMLRADVKEIPELKTRIQNTIYAQLPEARESIPMYRRPFLRVAAAAIIFLMLSAGGYFYFNNRSEKQVTERDPSFVGMTDVAPGGNKAVLTLANGKQIILDNAANGDLTQQGNTKIIKLDSGQLAYQPVLSNGQQAVEISYNTVSTPKGGQYQILLADGSKVWLNAASSLRFPTAFSKERNVELTGEGYFEVAHRLTPSPSPKGEEGKSLPFTVTVNGMKVEVLGTHFNINAYDDEAVIKTTLIEGSVKISKDAKSSLLVPGKQAIVSNDGEIKIINADIDEVMGWKNGMFHFESADLKTILRQFARWYDMEIIYESKISEKKYFCIVNKNVSLSNVLKALQANDIKFRIEGKKLFVQ